MFRLTTSQDIRELICIVKKKVKEQPGIELESEIRVIPYHCEEP